MSEWLGGGVRGGGGSEGGIRRGEIYVIMHNYLLFFDITTRGCIVKLQHFTKLD